jgi:photosystem II stability/assembly factor-like uncharacterized protein
MGMTSSYRPLFGAILATLSIVTAGCATAVSPPALTGYVVGARLHPHGPFPGLRYRVGGTVRLTGAPAPASSALPGANDLLTAGTAALAAADTGIWRSTDGGISWRRVLAGIEAWSVTAVPGGGYAALGGRPAPIGVGRPVLATSSDGVSWRIRAVRASRSQWPFGYGYRFVLTGLGSRAAGVAVPDVGEGVGDGYAYRTTDGGLRWTPLSLRTASTGLAMLADGRTMFATAPGPSRACAGAVYESDDAGASWRLLRQSCRPYPLLAVQFISARLGFAGGGQPAKFGGEQLVEATTDGGRTWHMRWRTPVENGLDGNSAVLRLDMVSARQGWAVTGGCVGGENGPCPGTIYATTDGGFRWQATSQDGITIASLGTGRAVSADDRYHTTSVTSNGGRAWSTQTSPLAISTSAFSGVGRFQLWVTNLGDFISTDGGSKWSPAAGLAAARFAYETWLAAQPARLLGYPGDGNLTWASSDAGRTWTSGSVPHDAAGNPLLALALGAGGAAIAVTGPGAQCLSPAGIAKVEKAKPGWKPPAGASVLYTSVNGGASWKHHSGTVLPFDVGVGATAAADGPRIAIIDACGRLQLSADGGARWHAEPIGQQTFCTVSELGGQIWMACQPAGNQNWLLYSADGGSTWMAYRLPAAVNGTNGIFATGPGSAVMPIGGSIWSTTDGGASWSQSWPID